MKIFVAIEGEENLAEMFEDVVFALAQGWTFRDVAVSEERREE